MEPKVRVGIWERYHAQNFDPFLKQVIKEFEFTFGSDGARVAKEEYDGFMNEIKREIEAWD